ncbi:hypothetical protein [Nocardia huaxiensis]|uniref:Tetratricopeptide repeat protein n=1 Tax=Nocardia huaxiensis TaxID=2755382 RepID=A0A7D6ZS44_9NOCA|nr:hypothetical protein [Nocardia huaxiensis]QLY33983.1 hypothetical protein H0264_18660 [Nocardia huaxiensis]UFS99115.1 hypothetical protein LPY97_15050 [Nocardia huaxiensis]
MLLAELGIQPTGLAKRMKVYSSQDNGPVVSLKSANILRYLSGGNRPKQRTIDVMVAVLSIASGRALTAADIGYSDQPAGGIDAEVEMPKARQDPFSLPFETVDPAFIEHLTALLDAHARMDALSGPRYVLGTLDGELQLVQDLCGKARGEMRPALLQVGTRFCEFAGWLYQDSGDLRCALYWTNRAMDYAEELYDPHLRSYVLQRRSNIATESGYAQQGLGLGNAALREWDAIPPELRAVALRQLANAYAMTGEADECRKALDQAMEQVLSVDAAGPSSLALYCTPSYIEMEAAQSWVRLGQPERAIETYTMALSDWPKAQRRDQGLCTVRLASACIDAGQFEAGAQAGIQAASVIRSAPSARALGVLKHLAQRVRPVQGDAIREFESAVTDLV